MPACFAETPKCFAELHPRALQVIERARLEIAKAEVGRRQCVSPRVPGARSPDGPAQPARELVEIEERSRDGKRVPMTPVGYRTARTRLPRILAMLDPEDPRRQAADMIADCAERLTSPGAAGGGGRSGAVSDHKDRARTRRRFLGCAMPSACGGFRRRSTVGRPVRRQAAAQG